jgi:hypothetical protein
MSPETALAIARERLPTLYGNGILPKRAVGVPVDLDDLAAALAFLSRCRKTKVPTVHSFDLRRAVGVQLGAVIAAATALGFDVRNWMGVTEFGVHAVIGVDQDDVARVAQSVH